MTVDISTAPAAVSPDPEALAWWMDVVSGKTGSAAAWLPRLGLALIVLTRQR
jgi:hypothetical protein